MSSHASRLRALSQFQCGIIRFIRTRENAVRKNGIEPLQFQFLSIVDPLHRTGRQPNISQVAMQLGMHHHSAVELVDRLVDRGLLRRKRANHDRRQVLLEVTPEGRKLVKTLVQQEYADVQEFAPDLLHDLRTFLDGAQVKAGRKSTLHT